MDYRFPKNGIIIVALILVTLLIPVMWLTGHRGNNTLLFFLILFTFFMIISRPFSGRVGEILSGLAADAGKVKKLIASLVAITAVLVILHFVYSGRVHFWNLDREEGVATLFSAVILAANVLVLMACRQAAALESHRWKWLLAAILFAGLATDELSEVHSWIPQYIWGRAGGAGETVLGGLVIWVVVLSPILIVIIISMLWFFFNVLSRKARLPATGALFCWCLVLLVEVTGKIDILPWVIETGLEETCEMLGSILFLVAFLMELGRLQSLKSVSLAEE